MRRCTDGGLGFHPARTDDGDGWRNPELGGRRRRADAGGGAAPFLPVASAADSVPSRRERRVPSRLGRGSRSRTREVGNADPRENGVGLPRGWASKQQETLARVRFPRGRPTRGKGRDPRRKSGSQTRRESIPHTYEQSHTRRRKSSTPAFPNSAVTSTTARRHRQR